MSNSTSTANQEDIRGKVTAIVVAILLLIIVIIATLLLLRHYKQLDSRYTPDLDSRAIAWTGQLVDSVQQLQQSGDSTGITIPGYPSITVSAGSTTMYVSLFNPEGNPCYFTYTMTLADTGEVLFTTKEIEPGQTINQFEMSRSLSAGEYTAIVTVSTTSLEDGSPMNGANMETLLVVQ